MVNYLLLFSVPILVVFTQIILKWQANKSIYNGNGIKDKILFYIKLLLKPIILLTYLATIIRILIWIIVLSKFDLSYAFLFTSLNFVLIYIASIFFFKEKLNFNKNIGVFLIIAGVILMSI